MLKVVLDTNVFVSSLLIPSRLNPIFEAINNKMFLVILSPSIINELLEVLNRPKILRIVDKESKSILLKDIKDKFQGLFQVILQLIQQNPYLLQESKT